MTIQSKASGQDAVVVFVVMLYNAVLTFEFETVSEIPWCKHSKKSYWQLFFFCGALVFNRS